jgi:methylenetetrahydrofolate--tRNA-(uracil-5-)-methyltransferase
MLFEMRPARMTPAHVTGQLAELVCSNSLGSDLPDRAAGILKRELRQLDSLIMRCADETAVPAGGALAVDRQRFADTRRPRHHPRSTAAEGPPFRHRPPSLPAGHHLGCCADLLT